MRSAVDTLPAGAVRPAGNSSNRHGVHYQSRGNGDPLIASRDFVDTNDSSGARPPAAGPTSTFRARRPSMRISTHI